MHQKLKILAEAKETRERPSTIDEGLSRNRKRLALQALVLKFVKYSCTYKQTSPIWNTSEVCHYVCVYFKGSLKSLGPLYRFSCYSLTIKITNV